MVSEEIAHRALEPLPDVFGRLHRDPALNEVEPVTRLVGQGMLGRARERVFPPPRRRHVDGLEREGVDDLLGNGHLVYRETAAAIAREEDPLASREPRRIHRRAEEPFEPSAVTVRSDGVKVQGPAPVRGERDTAAVRRPGWRLIRPRAAREVADREGFRIDEEEILVAVGAEARPVRAERDLLSV